MINEKKKRNRYKNSLHDTYMLKSTVAKQGLGKRRLIKRNQATTAEKQHGRRREKRFAAQSEKKEAIEHMRTYKRTRKKIR